MQSRVIANFQGEAVVVIVKEADQTQVSSRAEAGEKIVAALNKEPNLFYIEYDGRDTIRIIRKVEYKKTMAQRKNERERDDFEKMLRENGAKDFGLYVNGFAIKADEIVTN